MTSDTKAKEHERMRRAMDAIDRLQQRLAEVLCAARVHAAALVHPILPLFSYQSAFQRGSRLLPYFITTDRLLRPRTQHQLVVREPELRQDLLRQLQHVDNLVFELIRSAKNVRVVLSEASHSHETL